MPVLPPLRLTGARVLRDSVLQDIPLTFADGVISDDPAPEINLSGYVVLPGIVDLHGDGFERHLTPRPSAPFDKAHALRSVAAELSANGVTTAWMAQSWSWEGGFRSADATEQLLDALDNARPHLLPDMRVQIRLETHVPDDHPRLLQAVAHYGVDYVVFNNHLPEALEMAVSAPARFAQWAAQQGRNPDRLLTIVRQAAERDSVVPAALGILSKALAARNVSMGSHDDGDATTRQRFSAFGAPICEFPTTVDAARAACDANEPVLMGAPNVVRGGSQTGNIAAEDLIAEGLCDALVSDYYYPALAQAACALAARGTLDFEHAWQMISTTPASILGLSDRGRLDAGLRADLVIMNPETHMIEATIVEGCLAFAQGTVGSRLMGSTGHIAAQ